jgi:ATP synthase protein I
MRNSMAAGRRLALRAVTLQAAVAAAVAFGFLLQGSASALAAGIGGAAVVTGSALLALSSFAAPAGAGVALARMLVGMLLKWGVVLGTLLYALAVLRVPPLPLLAGAVATTLAFLFIGKTEDKGGL